MGRAARFALLAVLLAVASGCGGGGSRGERLSKSEYLDRIRAVESGDRAREATDVFTKKALSDPALPQAECAARARTLHADLEQIVDEIDGLRPPSEVQAIQDEFVSAARETVDIIGGLRDDVKDGKVRCGEDFNRRAYGLPSTARAQRAVEKLGDLGYRVGLNSDD